MLRRHIPFRGATSADMIGHTCGLVGELGGFESIIIIIMTHVDVFFVVYYYIIVCISIYFTQQILS